MSGEIPFLGLPHHPHVPRNGADCDNQMVFEHKQKEQMRYIERTRRNMYAIIAIVIIITVIKSLWSWHLFGLEASIICICVSMSFALIITLIIVGYADWKIWRMPR